MENEKGKTRYRLPRSLSGKADFDRVFRNGKRYRHAFLQIIVYASVQGSDGRIGFVIPDKSVKKSSRRNRIRRLLRESIRHWWGYIKDGHDIVFRVLEFPEIDHARYVESVFLKLMIDSGYLTDEGRVKAREILTGSGVK